MNDKSELGRASWWDARYREGTTPWDQGTVAPEVLAFAAEHPGNDGWALEIGCGTGTHGRGLARAGYRLVGLDLSHVALQQALAVARAEALNWVGIQASAPDLLLLKQQFAVALDVGCFHGLSQEQRVAYGVALSRRLQPGGYYLVYAVHEKEQESQGGPPGVPPEQTAAVFGAHLDLVWRQEGRQGERHADWWLWQKSHTSGS